MQLIIKLMNNENLFNGIQSSQQISKASTHISWKMKQTFPKHMAQTSQMLIHRDNSPVKMGAKDSIEGG